MNKEVMTLKQQIIEIDAQVALSGINMTYYKKYSTFILQWQIKNNNFFVKDNYFVFFNYFVII